MRKNSDSMGMKIISHSLVGALVLSSVAPSISFASAAQCKQLFNIMSLSQSELNTKSKSDLLSENYSKRNKTLSERYPKLAFMFNDPEGFVKNVRERFEAQKKITPDDPRVFNFPEAEATMREIHQDLENFRQEVVADLQKEKSSVKNKLSHLILERRSQKVETLTKVLKYINKVQVDVEKMFSTNEYPYRDTVYTLYYYSRIRGIFQFKELSPYYQALKYLDMVMHGYRRLNIDQELSLYENKGNPLLQVRSGKISHEFRTAELPFRDAFERTDRLDYIIFPSVHALGASAFLHVLPYKIHILGATNAPIKADGFNRPGGLFWMHDVRHEADRYMKVESYRKSQNLTDKQDTELKQYMVLWHKEFLDLKNSVQDSAVKESLDHYHFYTHHDVGVPMIPSMFLNHHKDGMTVYYAFLWHKKFAGQTPKYNEWTKNTKQAQEILEKFWSERLEIEKRILGKDPVKIKSWEDWFPMSNGLSKSMTSVFNKAIETKSLVRLMAQNAGIEGVLNDVVYSADGAPAYVKFNGPARLVEAKDLEIKGQGVESHAGGYSTPIGKIKTVMLDGVESSFSNLKSGQQVEIRYESGVIVTGEITTWSLDSKGDLQVLTFKKADVKMGERHLYKSSWGKFDMILGTSVQSLEILI